MKTTLSVLIILISALISETVWAQNNSAYGHGALQVFDQRGFAATPMWVQLWISFMVLTFFCSLFFIRRHSVARWVITCFTAGVVATAIATNILNVTPLSGFLATMHLLFWSPALYQLLRYRPFLGPINAFSIWTGVMTGVILFSFVFDIRDSVIYLRNL